MSAAGCRRGSAPPARACEGRTDPWTSSGLRRLPVSTWAATRLFVDPPLLDVVRGTDRSRREVLDCLLRENEVVRRVDPDDRHVLVELLVDVVGQLVARRLAAVRAGVDLVEHAVDVRIPVAPAIELVRRDVRRVPEVPLVGVGPEPGEAADPALEILPATADALQQRVERLEDRIDPHADLLVLLLRELEDRLANRVRLVRLDPHLHGCSVGPAVDAVRPHLRPGLLDELFRLLRIERVLVEVVVLVRRVPGWLGRVEELTVPEDDLVDDRLTVEPVPHGLANELVREPRCLRRLRVPREVRPAVGRELEALEALDLR